MFYGTGGFAYGGGSAHFNVYDDAQGLLLAAAARAPRAPAGRSAPASNTRSPTTSRSGANISTTTSAADTCTTTGNLAAVQLLRGRRLCDGQGQLRRLDLPRRRQLQVLILSRICRNERGKAKAFPFSLRDDFRSREVQDRILADNEMVHPDTHRAPFPRTTTLHLVREQSGVTGFEPLRLLLPRAPCSSANQSGILPVNSALDTNLSVQESAFQTPEKTDYYQRSMRRVRRCFSLIAGRNRAPLMRSGVSLSRRNVPLYGVSGSGVLSAGPASAAGSARLRARPRALAARIRSRSMRGAAGPSG